jgi:hypothetical protein
MYRRHTCIVSFEVRPCVFALLQHDPVRLRSTPEHLCKWSFNWVKEVDPEFAAVVLERRQ